MRESAWDLRAVYIRDTDGMGPFEDDYEAARWLAGKAIYWAAPAWTLGFLVEEKAWRSFRTVARAPPNDDRGRWVIFLAGLILRSLLE